MKALDVAQAVVAEKQCHLFRERKGEPGQYDAKPFGEGSKRGWVYLDGFSASAIVNVHAALNPENQKKFEGLSLEKMARIAFKLIK